MLAIMHTASELETFIVRLTMVGGRSGQPGCGEPHQQEPPFRAAWVCLCSHDVLFLQACVSVFINSLKWSSVVQIILSARLVYLIVRWQPQL